jgi:hypothetical protein
MRREKLYKPYIIQSYSLTVMAFCLLNINNLCNSASFQQNTNDWKTFLLCEYLDLRKWKYLDFFLKDAPSKAVYKLYDRKTQTPSKQFYPVGKWYYHVGCWYWVNKKPLEQVNRIELCRFCRAFHGASSGKKINILSLS